MYEPGTCPVCDSEYRTALETPPNTMLHSGHIDSRFCVMGSETGLLIYVHEGDITDVWS